MKSFSNKVAAITGAGSGMGRSLAIKLAERGCHVAVSDVNEVGLAETVRLAGMHGVKVTSKRVDVSKREEVYTWADEVVADHGKCNLIFNNAGVAYGATVEGCDYEDAEWVVGINFWGVVYGTKAFLPLLRKRPEAHIANISSINGMVPFAKNAPYNMSKYAVLGFSETLMQELSGQSIHVTCVHPGGIKTNIARNGRGATEAEIAFFDRIAMTTADTTARVTLDAVEHNRERVLVGADAKVMAAAKRLLPSWTVRLIGAASWEIPRWGRSAVTSVTE